MRKIKSRKKRAYARSCSCSCCENIARLRRRIAALCHVHNAAIAEAAKAYARNGAHSRSQRRMMRLCIYICNSIQKKTAGRIHGLCGLCRGETIAKSGENAENNLDIGERVDYRARERRYTHRGYIASERVGEMARIRKGVNEQAAEASKPCCHCGKQKLRTAEELKPLIHRLNRIEGQIRGIRGMLEKDAYCPDILVQSSAAESALRAFNRELISQHIRTCVVRDIAQGKPDVVGELCATLQKLMK